MHYHVRITLKSDAKNKEVKVDLSKEQLIDRFLTPYEQGEYISINGKTIYPENIERLEVSQSPHPSEYYINILKNNDSRSSVLRLNGPSYESRVVDYVDNVTDDYIQGPPGYKKNSSIKTEIPNGKISSNKIFIVHGHDEAIKETVARFVEKMDLEPIILHEQANGGRTIIEKFEKYSDVDFAVVLMTPDDIGTAKDNPDSLTPRARQNVIFELGFFIGKLSRKNVCALYKEGVDIPSDYQGVIFIPIDTSGAWKLLLAKEIKEAGIDIDLNKVFS